MTSDQLYNQYQGTSIPSFDGNPANNGQCEQWYLMNRTKRDGFGPIGGNAIDRWYVQETDKYDYIPIAPGVYPLKDDYVVWGAGVGSIYGHIDVCAQNGTASGFLGYDSNWEDIPTLRTITHNYAYGILGYVRRKTMFNEADRVNINTYLYGKDRGFFKAQVGQSYHDAMYGVLNGAEFIFEYKVNDGDVGNINNILKATTASQAKNQNWKDTFYGYVAKNLPSGTTPTVLAKGDYRVQ